MLCSALQLRPRVALWEIIKQFREIICSTERERVRERKRGRERGKEGGIAAIRAAFEVRLLNAANHRRSATSCKLVARR